VKWWGIGNEMWGDFQYDHMVLSQFDNRNLFGEVMRKVAPSITVVADGNTPRMGDTLTDNHWAIGGELRRISFRRTRPRARAVSRRWIGEGIVALWGWPTRLEI
jgi:hypothetical protein